MRIGEGMAVYTAKADWAPKDMMLRDGTVVSKGTRIFYIYGESSEFCVSEEEYWAKWASKITPRTTSTRPVQTATPRRVNGRPQPSTHQNNNRPQPPPKPMRIAPIAFNPQRRRFSVSLTER